MMVLYTHKRYCGHSPQRNNVFCSRNPLSLPMYRFWVRFSVDTTSAVLLGFAARMFFTSSTEITPAEQPWQNMQVITIVRGR